MEDYSEKMNILFTSVGRRSYLLQYFKEALKGKGKIYAANSTSDSPAFLVADEYVVTPIIYDKNYIPFLLDYCQEKQISALISLFDVDLPVLSRHKEVFEKIGTKIILSDFNVVDICNDKYKTYEFLKKNNVFTPMTYLSCEECFEALRKEEIRFPLVLKPRWGMGSIGIYVAENKSELEVLYDKIKWDIKHTYLKYESEKDWLNSVIIQEKLIGQEYGLDVINDLNGQYKTTICKIKYAMRSGETDCAMVVDSARLESLGKRLAGLLKHRVNLDVDVFETGDQVYVLEMNARFGGGYPFSHMAGVDLPRAIISWLEGKNEPDGCLTAEMGVKSSKDIHMVRL